MIVMFRRILGKGLRNNSLTFRGHLGFTLLEVLMAIVLVAIGTALALPSYHSMVEKRQLTRDAERLASFVSSVQSAAARANRVVTVSYTRVDHEKWCIGAAINATDTACDCTETITTASDYCAIDGQQFVLDDTDANNLQLLHGVTGDGDYAFDPIRGLFVDPNDALTMELHTDSRKFKLNLTVNNTGRVILCSKDADHDIPGFEVCPSEPVEEAG
jgi:prepilin-type N-terminal cleavage/methylation domain-containing protein